MAARKHKPGRRSPAPLSRSQASTRSPAQPPGARAPSGTALCVGSWSRRRWCWSPLEAAGTLTAPAAGMPAWRYLGDDGGAECAPPSSSPSESGPPPAGELLSRLGHRARWQLGNLACGVVVAEEAEDWDWHARAVNRFFSGAFGLPGAERKAVGLYSIGESKAAFRLYDEAMAWARARVRVRAGSGDGVETDASPAPGPAGGGEKTAASSITQGVDEGLERDVVIARVALKGELVRAMRAGPEGWPESQRGTGAEALCPCDRCMAGRLDMLRAMLALQRALVRRDGSERWAEVGSVVEVVGKSLSERAGWALRQGLLLHRVQAVVGLRPAGSTLLSVAVPHHHPATSALRVAMREVSGAAPSEQEVEVFVRACVYYIFVRERTDAPLSHVGAG